MTKIKITLTEPARHSAQTMRIMRGIQTPNDFEGPVFENVKSSHYDAHFFQIELEDGSCYAYAMNTIARIAEYPAG